MWKLLSLQSPPSLSPNLLCLLKEVMGTLGMAVRLAGTWKLLTSSGRLKGCFKARRSRVLQGHLWAVPYPEQTLHFPT